MSDNIRQTPAITQNISRGITNVLGHSIRNPAYHPDLTGREKPDQHPMEAITGLQSALDNKVSTTTEVSKVYGTDNEGNQTLYNVDSFGKVDDVKVGGTSVVTNKIANLGTMAGEASSDYTKTANLAPVALDNDYESLNNKPMIGEAVLSLQKNGTTVGTFSANATENTTINVEVPRIIIRRL